MPFNELPTVGLLLNGAQLEQSMSKNRVKCECGKAYSIPADTAKRKFKCKNCGSVLIVPDSRKRTRETAKPRSESEYDDEVAEDDRVLGEGYKSGLRKAKRKKAEHSREKRKKRKKSKHRIDGFEGRWKVVRAGLLMTENGLGLALIGLILWAGLTLLAFVLPSAGLGAAFAIVVFYGGGELLTIVGQGLCLASPSGWRSQALILVGFGCTAGAIALLVSEIVDAGGMEQFMDRKEMGVGAVAAPLLSLSRHLVFLFVIRDVMKAVGQWNSLIVSWKRPAGLLTVSITFNLFAVIAFVLDPRRDIYWAISCIGGPFIFLFTLGGFGTYVQLLRELRGEMARVLG